MTYRSGIYVWGERRKLQELRVMEEEEEEEGEDRPEYLSHSLLGYS